jgi:hypothetical protein
MIEHQPFSKAGASFAQGREGIMSLLSTLQLICDSILKVSSILRVTRRPPLWVSTCGDCVTIASANNLRDFERFLGYHVVPFSHLYTRSC